MADIFGFGPSGGDDPSNDVSARIPFGSSGMGGFGGGDPGFLDMLQSDTAFIGMGDARAPAFVTVAPAIATAADEGAAPEDIVDAWLAFNAAEPVSPDATTVAVAPSAGATPFEDPAPLRLAVRDFQIADDRGAFDWWNDTFLLPPQTLRARR